MGLDGTFNILPEEGIKSTIYAIRNLSANLSILQQTKVLPCLQMRHMKLLMSAFAKGVVRLAKTLRLPHLILDLEAFQIL